MQVNNDMYADGSSDYYTESFRYTLEAHIPYFKNRSSTQLAPVTPHNTIVYNQDFFGFLLSLRVQPCYHWFIMRLNDYTSPFDFTRGVSNILLPAVSELESIRLSWKATTVISS